MISEAQQKLAKVLSGLRQDQRQRSGLDPALVPSDHDSAYIVAGLVAEELGWEVGGWKVGAMKEELQTALRSKRPIYGRVFRKFMTSTPTAVDFSTLNSPIPEVELQAVLGRDLPPRIEPYSIQEVTDAVSTLHPGIEIGECRFLHDDVFPPLTAILADGAGSGRIIFGRSIEGWRDMDLASVEARLFVNGTERRRGTVAAAMDHPMVPLTWLANELSRTNIGLKAGQMISTGTLTGMVAARAGDKFVADYGPLGTVEVEIVG